MDINGANPLSEIRPLVHLQGLGSCRERCLSQETKMKGLMSECVWFLILLVSGLEGLV